MEVQKRRRGRPSTGRFEESLQAERTYRAAWYANRKRVWLTNRVHRTWKVLKGKSLLSSDSDFAAYLLSLEMPRVESKSIPNVSLLKGDLFKCALFPPYLYYACEMLNFASVYVVPWFRYFFLSTDRVVEF